MKRSSSLVKWGVFLASTVVALESVWIFTYSPSIVPYNTSPEAVNDIAAPIYFDLEDKSLFEVAKSAPLFTVDRQPFTPLVQEEKEETPIVLDSPEEIIEEMDDIDLSLHGIIHSPRMKVAVVQVDGKETVRLKKGDRTQGWEVIDIRESSVDIRKGNDVIQLTLPLPKQQ